MTTDATCAQNSSLLTCWRPLFQSVTVSLSWNVFQLNFILLLKKLYNHTFIPFHSALFKLSINICTFLAAMKLGFHLRSGRRSSGLGDGRFKNKQNIFTNTVNLLTADFCFLIQQACLLDGFFSPSCAIFWFEFSRAASLEKAGMLCRRRSLASVSFKRQSVGCLSRRSFAAHSQAVCVPEQQCLLAFLFGDEL